MLFTAARSKNYITADLKRQKKLVSIAAYLTNINHQLVKTSILTLTAISTEETRDEA